MNESEHVVVQDQVASGRPIRNRGNVVRTICVVAMAMILAACGSNGQAVPDADEGTEAPDTGDDGQTEDDPFLTLCPPDEAPDSLVLAIWGGPHVPVLDESLAGFTDLTGVNVTYTEDTTGDRLTKLNAEKGAPSIDVAILPINEVATLLENDVILPTDTEIPNYDVMKPAAQVDGGYGISLFQEVIAYNPEFVTEPPESWLDLFEGENRSHLAWGAIPGANGYAATVALAKSLGGSEDDLGPALEMLSDAADDIVTFTDFGPSIEPYAESEEVWIYPQLSGVLQDFRQRGGPIELTVPEEGGPLLMNTATIPDGARSVGCSQALVGWLLSDEVQTAYAEQLYYSPATTTVELDDELSELIYPKDDSTVMDIDWDIINENAQDIIDQWNRTVVGGG